MQIDLPPHAAFIGGRTFSYCPPESAFQKTSADLYLLPDSDTEIMKTASKDEITSLMKKTILR